MITFEHGNDNFTGSQLLVDIVPASKRRKGQVRLEIRRQEEGRESDGKARFSAAGGASIAVGVVAVAHILNVLTGKESGILGTKGIRSRDGECSASMHLDRVDEPFPGFAIHVQNRSASGERSDARIVLSLSEGAALAYSLQAAMDRVAFGSEK